MRSREPGRFYGSAPGESKAEYLFDHRTIQWLFGIPFVVPPGVAQFTKWRKK
jgi:hypothetical protein